MEFIKDMHEARMTRTSGTLKSLTYTDCRERLYLSVLILEALNQYAYFRRTASEYAKRTTGYDTFKAYRMSGTDLYNLAYFVNGDEDAMNKLKDPETGKYTLPNDGRYLKQWQLEAFYQNNPNGLLKVFKPDGLQLIIPEDKEWKREQCQYVNVYQEDQELLAKIPVDDFIDEILGDRNSEISKRINLGHVSDIHVYRQDLLEAMLKDIDNYPEFDFSAYVDDYEIT